MIEGGGCLSKAARKAPVVERSAFATGQARAGLLLWFAAARIILILFTNVNKFELINKSDGLKFLVSFFSF